MKFTIATLFLALTWTGVRSIEGPSPLESSYTSLISPVKERSSRDTFDVPEWLQDIPAESKVAKYRKRRFLSFPTGSTLDFKMSFTITVPEITEIKNFQFVTNFDLTLSNSTDFNFLDDVNFLGRSLEHGRNDVYRAAERVMNTFGFDGRACTLRTICEVAEMPFEHGVFGEVVNYLMTYSMGSSNQLESNEIVDDYSQAEFYGRHHGACDALYSECPISITNVLSTATHLTH